MRLVSSFSLALALMAAPLAADPRWWTNDQPITTSPGVPGEETYA